MSAQEQPVVREETDARASCKLIRNARGAVQIELRAVADDRPGDLEAAKAQAVKIFNELCALYPVQA